MASRQGAMSPETARRLAALIVAGAEQLEEKAQQVGVTAFVGQAVQRERLNERFLQSTLRNVASANRRADERVMWAAWEARKQKLPDNSRRAPVGCGDNGRSSSRDGQSGRGSRKRRRSSSRERSATGRSSKGRRSSSKQRREQYREPQNGRRTQKDGSKAAASGSNNGGSGSGSHSGSSAEETGSDSNSTDSSEGRAADQPGSPPAGDYAAADDDVGDDQQLLQWLGSSQKVRGRGAVGPSADMPGPYLEAPSGVSPTELHQIDRGSAKGPGRPSWMPKADAERRRLRPNAGFLQGLLRAQGIIPAGGSASQREVEQGAEPELEGQQGPAGHSRGRGSGEGSSDSGSGERRVRRKRSKSKKRKHKSKRSSKHKRKHKRRDSS